MARLAAKPGSSPRKGAATLRRSRPASRQAAPDRRSGSTHDAIVDAAIRLIRRRGYNGVTIEANANDEGHLYGSVGAPEISKALKARNLPVEVEMVRLEGHIKETGLYEVKLNLGYEIETTVKVAVVKGQEKK